ncbi:MAG TPA: branched-chain amino acid ABC transporter ATP-binding protein/permease [Hyphomicrobiaceae bacterium]|nr:branched-chain amino acid ABC transporter ATP-binding protein/permease [Hyphomicrobiaceae bacterium]
MNRALEVATIAVLATAGLGVALLGEGYTPFVLALVALTTIVGVGLNILVGLAGQISIGHIGFYAIGAYAVAVLTLKGINFWAALACAGALAAAIGALLALPAIRVSGPYLAMMTIAFAFIVQHTAIEWREVTGGQNGLMNLPQPALGGGLVGERSLAVIATLLAALSLYFFHRLARSGWGMAMIAVRDSEIAARAVGFQPLIIKTLAFALSAALTGVAGGVFAALFAFVAPDSFPFSQSILFLLAVIVGGAGWTLAPLVGAAVIVVLPELIASLAEYRLLAFGALLLLVLWLAPEGVIGLLSRAFSRIDRAMAQMGNFSLQTFLAVPRQRHALTVDGLSIAFGGVRAASDVALTAEPGHITALIGPNGAGKTTVLNMIGGFYAPDAGSIRLGEVELAGASAQRVARAGIARTYQTTQLFGSLSVLDNVLLGLRRGRLGNPFAAAAGSAERRDAEGLLAFVGYRGPLGVAARDLPHVDRRLVEIARALATRPSVLLLDEPAAGLMRADKVLLVGVLRQLAAAGLAVILVEHDMALVMGLSDHVVVLDAGRPIAAGTPETVRGEPQVRDAYLGAGEIAARPRSAPLAAAPPQLLAAKALGAGYGSVPVLDGVAFEVGQGELVTMLGANGAGKSTTLRALSGLLRPVSGSIMLAGGAIETQRPHRIVREGLILVPEGRQVFPELSVRDNLILGAHTRKGADLEREIAALLQRFPRLAQRIDGRAGLLSGGEQQMLAIARGLMGRPRLLLLDEPSLGLAPAIIDELFGTLAELRDQGITILLVDQMAALALAVADRGYVLELGRVVRADTAQVLAKDPALEAAYLGGQEAAE